MMSIHGLKKPSYKAFQLLGKLGDKQIQVKGTAENVLQNAIAAKSKDGYQFLFYAFDITLKLGDASKMTPIPVVLPKVKLSNISVHQIGNIEKNVINKWTEMGQPAYLKYEQLAELKKMNDFQK